MHMCICPCLAPVHQPLISELLTHNAGQDQQGGLPSSPGDALRYVLAWVTAKHPSRAPFRYRALGS